MSTVAVRDDTTDASSMAPVSSSTTTADAMARLADWAASVTNVSRVITPLIGTPFVPLIDSKGQRRDREIVEAEAIGKVLYGLALGWDPLTSLQQIILIPGRTPSMYAKAKVAQLQSRGYRIRVVELTEDKCVMAGARPGANHEETVTVTMDDARRGKWGEKNDNYDKNPKDMLHWRAAGRLCDQIGADVLMGLATAEDVADLPPVRAEATVGTPTDPPPLTGAQIIAQAAAQPATEPVALPEPERVDPKASDTQLKRMFALLAQHGLGGRDRREQAIAWISQTIGREIVTRDDLTASEVKRLCEVLEQASQPAEAGPAEAGTEPEPNQ